MSSLVKGHRFHPSVLRDYDIRGMVGDVLSERDAYATGRSFGSLVRQSDGRKVAVGYDGRSSSLDLESALVKGLTESGVDVIRIGLGPTPMLYFAEMELEVDGAIQVTGSHSPIGYNGFKIVLRHRAVDGDVIQKMGRMAVAGEWSSGKGAISEIDVLDGYIERISENCGSRALRVGWDAGNGAAGPAVEKLVERLPGEHFTIFTNIDGDFPNHHPDPSDEKNLDHLKRLVIENGLDLGLAFDGDGDRLGVIDGQGRVVWPDQLLAIFARPILKDRPKATVIADVKASDALYEVIGSLGGTPCMWKAGRSYIRKKMEETRSPLVGEMSGHLFFADDYYGFDDGLYAALRLLRAVSDESRTLAEMRDELPAKWNTPELRIPVDGSRKFEVVDEVLQRLEHEQADIVRIDGARVSTPDGWWLLRASNTEDILVARAEATSDEGLGKLLRAIDKHLAASGVARATQ